MRRNWLWGIIGLSVPGLTVVHFFVANLPLTVATPLILLDHLWLLGLLAFLLWLFSAVGLTIVARLGINFDAPVEALPFSVALGLSALMMAMTWAGFVGLFNLGATIFLLAGLTWLSRSKWHRAAALWQSIAGHVLRLMCKTGEATFWRISAILIGLVLVVAAIPTLAPVNSYDALMYHLPAPSTFIKLGRIVPFPQEIQPNYPLGFEMLYAIGLMLRADRLAQMLHFSTVVLLVTAIYAFAHRFFGRLTGLLAVVILLALPKITLIGGWAFTDMAFVFFTTLAVYAFTVWWHEDSFSWLLLTGLLCGVGLSLKYYGLRPVLVLGLALLWKEVQRGFVWKRFITNSAGFGGGVFLLAAPWYIKNWLWLNNPIYPFFLGGINWNSFRAEEWARWVSTFGHGHSLADYLLLPINVWLFPNDFSVTPFGYFNGGLLLAVIALLMKPPRLIIGLWLYVVAQLYLWGIMMQELRYLLLILPWLSLGAGWALARLFGMSVGHRWLGAGVRIMPLVLLAVPLAIHIGVLTPFSKNPGPVTLGLESPADYLGRTNYIYGSMEFINTRLSAKAKIVYLWEGQTYYCHRDCLADPIYDRWGDLMYQHKTPEAVLLQMKLWGATHLLINHHDGLEPALRGRDLAGPRAQYIDAFRLFRDQYLTTLYADKFIALYRINYPAHWREITGADKQ